MYCHKCGKENHENSKFCRYCGNNILENTNRSSKKKIINNLTWKSPVVLVIIIIFIIGGLIWGGNKGFAYFNIASKINTAKKLQISGDYQKSIDLVNGLQYEAFTNNQKNVIEGIITDNQKFITFKLSFDSAVAHENDTSSTDLQDALKKLQSIDSSYPNFKDVQLKMTKIQDKLMTLLQNESEVNKKAAADSASLAEKNKKAAAAALVLKNKAEQDAKLSADNARVEEVLKSFSNQLLTIRNNFSTSGVQQYINYMEASNDGDYNLAKVYGGGVISVCYSTQTNSKELRNNFTNLPTEYNNASINLEWAGYYLCEAISKWISGDISLSKQNSDNMFNYYKKVNSFFDL